MKGLSAVAAIDMGGFLAESAPVFKEGRGENKKVYILLTVQQRDKIGKWIIQRHDYEYQGKFPGALPSGFENLETRIPDRWHNASNQWFNVVDLYAYLNTRYDENEATKGMVLLMDLVKQARAMV